MKQITLVFHGGLIGADIEGYHSIAGTYKKSTYDEDGLKTVLNLQNKFKQFNPEFIVPNRFVHVLTENNIPGRVHMQQDIKTYLRTFNYLEKTMTKISIKDRSK